MAAPIARRRIVGAAVAVGALAFLGAMALTGGPRESQQLVRFRAAGLMTARPEDVDRIEIERDGRRLTLARAGMGWATEDGHRAAPASAAAHLQAALRFLHVAEPVRVMGRPEWDGMPESEFGLAPPRYEIRLAGRGGTMFAVRFGTTNPQQVLQYARVEGREPLYLMPRFVGAEWERLWDRLTEG